MYGLLLDHLQQHGHSVSGHACHKCRYGTSQNQITLTDTLAQGSHSDSQCQ